MMTWRATARNSAGCSQNLLNHFRNLLVFHVSRGDTSMLELSEVEAASLNEQRNWPPPTD